MSIRLILASQSPRRKELLHQLGYQFSTTSPNIDETMLENESAKHYVERVARNKALAIATKELDENVCILSADTSVVINDQVLGKPQNIEECCVHLQQLSNSTHLVYTAIAVVQGTKICSELVTTKVTFKPLTPTEITNYWHTGEPADKAGSYGIQGIGGQFVTNIEGSYSAVVGLPLYETAQLLARFNLPSPMQAS